MWSAGQVNVENGNKPTLVLTKIIQTYVSKVHFAVSSCCEYPHTSIKEVTSRYQLLLPIQLTWCGSRPLEDHSTQGSSFMKMYGLLCLLNMVTSYKHAYL